jgi:hypothetical protein
MDVEIYEQSRNIMCLYQLLKLMRTIVETDPHAPPPEKRTINYFVTQYLERFSFTEFHRFHRDIHDKADPDVDEHGNTTKPRHPRHVARSDITSIFASQAEWILVDQLTKRESMRVIDVYVWKNFCELVREERRVAGSRNTRWGLEYGKIFDFRDSGGEIDLRRYATLGMDMTKLRLAARRMKTKQVIFYFNFIAVFLTCLQVSRDSPELAWKEDEDEEGQEDEPLPPTPEYTYDSDFSQLSSPSWSDSSSASIEPPDPEVFALLPPCLWHPPDLPDSTFLWQCPIHACKYTIDMLNLTDENVKCLDREGARFLRAKRWRISEEKVVSRFYDMVSDHWNDHLALKGIKLVNEHTPRVRFPSFAMLVFGH